MNHLVSQASVSRSIEEVTNAICRPELFNRFIRLPGTIAELTLLRNR